MSSIAASKIDVELGMLYYWDRFNRAEILPIFCLQVLGARQEGRKRTKTRLTITGQSRVQGGDERNLALGCWGQPLEREEGEEREISI